ncbi:antimicrobial ginkbilobin-2-like protein [Quercus suber]|uniref:antimicrobial ginkbilobin-2-like protein n=1 Tax=Quercus suber TaxID=58331 RepID=UPI000CE19DEC|nr:cysteine-rich repeat secretory protein 38-like [Quercus suber]POF19345.1 cysteine-rich repeat secretory protein 38 [Quercus suber]
MGVKHNKTYGLALCRGDISEIDCAACVIDFSGQIDNQTVIYAWNTQNVSDPNSFNPKVRDLLTELAHQASESPKMYKAGVLKLDESRNLYGLVQCIGDLSGNDCTKCLEGATKQQPDCCDGRQGGRVMTGSCNMRYDLYQFFKA